MTSDLGATVRNGLRRYITRSAIHQIVLAGLLVLGACAAEEKAGITLVFKHGKLAGEPRVMREIIAGFEARHPGVNVVEEFLPASTDQQHQYFAVNLESRELSFDVMAVDVIWVQEFARAGWIQSLDDVLPVAERGSFFPAAIEAATYDRRVYAIPWYVDAGVLFYREDLLRRYGLTPPRTWPELVSAIRTITAGEPDGSVHGFVWPGRQSEALVCFALELIWGHGGTLLEPETAIPALTFMRELVSAKLSPAMVATADEEAARLLFGEGRAIFMRNWPYAWRFLQRPGSAVQGRIGMTALPTFPGHSPASVLGGWMLGVPSHARHPDLARDLVAYLGSDEVQQRMARGMGYSPARRAWYADAEPAAGGRPLSDLLFVLDHARARPLTPFYLMISYVLQPEFSAVLVGLKTPEAAVGAGRHGIARMRAHDEAI